MTKPTAAHLERLRSLIARIPCRCLSIAQLGERDPGCARCVALREAGAFGEPGVARCAAIYTAAEVEEAMHVLRGPRGSAALSGDVLDDLERQLLAAIEDAP